MPIFTRLQEAKLQRGSTVEMDDAKEDTQNQASEKPLVSIGWMLATDERDASLVSAYQEANRKLLACLAKQFPQFQWEMPVVNRGRYSPVGALDPLSLLEMGAHQKTHEIWDYALVVVPNELTPLDRVFTIGVPSSALEVAVISTARLHRDESFCEQLAALATHLLGHMWGLEHREEGPMVPPEEAKELQLVNFSPEEQAEVVDRLEEVSDKRLEERQSRWNRGSFYWYAFWADPKSILEDVWGYKPWRLPFRMGRVTTAAAASILVLLLAAESWEVGTNLSLIILTTGACGAVLMATVFIFFGQNLNEISREVGWREQLTRTRIVLFQTLLLGMINIWLLLFIASYIAVSLVPDQVAAKWLNETLNQSALIRQAAFMATLGVLAAALGGNLEDEDRLKAQLFYDEET